MFSKRSRAIKSAAFVFGVCTTVACGAAAAQSAAAAHRHQVDLTVGYSAARQNSVQGNSFWQQGGFAELSAEAFHGFGAALRVTGRTAVDPNGGGVDINTVTTVAGPRYTFRRHRFAIFGEGLLGESNGFDGAYPSPSGAIRSTNAFATEVNGGVDFAVGHRFAVRLLDAGWQRTCFPNATTNIQNTFTVGAGITFRFRR
jgi:hypothetical protein